MQIKSLIVKSNLKYLHGGADGTRTRYLFVANETLYQVSYDPMHYYSTQEWEEKQPETFLRIALFYLVK